MSMRLCTGVLAVIGFFSCSLIVKSMIDERVDAQDGDSDGEIPYDEIPYDETPDGEEPGDASEPDFNPVECAIWGRVAISDPAAVNIVSGANSLNAEGMMQYLFYIPGPNLGDPGIVLEYEEDDIDLTMGHFYCIPSDLLRETTECFIFATLYDTQVGAWQGNSYFFKSIIVDPLVGSIYQIYRQHRLSAYLEYTDLYWDGEIGARMDIPLDYRVSKYTGIVHFDESFPSDPVVGPWPRLCAYAYMPTGHDDPLIHDRHIGGRIKNIPYYAVKSGNEYEISLNVAARPGVEFSVYFYYVEYRDGYPDEASCGTAADPRSCTVKRAVIEAENTGGETHDTEPFFIMPIAEGSCPLDDPP